MLQNCFDKLKTTLYDLLEIDALTCYKTVSASLNKPLFQSLFKETSLSEFIGAN